MKRIIATSIITLSAVLFVHPFATATVTASAACVSQARCRSVCRARFERCKRNGGRNCGRVLSNCLRRCHNN